MELISLKSIGSPYRRRKFDRHKSLITNLTVAIKKNCGISYYCDRSLSIDSSYTTLDNEARQFSIQDIDYS